MKKMSVSLVLLALCFATGFTCSKNAPQQAAAPTETAPPMDTPAAPVDATPAATTTAQPATETK